MSKENKGRYQWNDGAKFETVDRAGRVYQWQNKPYSSQGSWWSNMEGLEWYVESIDPPKDYSATLIERYPKEETKQAAPFVFGPEHIARRVKHKDGDTGTIVLIDLSARKYDQITVRWSDNDIYTYSLTGEAHNKSGVVVSLDESQEYGQVPDPTLRLPEQPVITPTSQPAPAPETDYEETPFVPNRAEVWVRFMAASIAYGDYVDGAAIADEALTEYEKRFLKQ